MYVHGDRRDYDAVDIYVNGKYRCTTTWSRNLTEARARFLEAHPEELAETISACYTDNNQDKQREKKKRIRLWI
jgi:hypothetical protein